MTPSMIERIPCVYIPASGHNGHTKRYGILKLVYFEVAETMEAAIMQEKQLKRWQRDWKRNIIGRENPAWNDLGVSYGLDPLSASSSSAVGPGTSPG